MTYCTVVKGGPQSDRQTDRQTEHVDSGGAVIMAIAIARVHPVHVMNADSAKDHCWLLDQISSVRLCICYGPNSPSPIILLLSSKYDSHFVIDGVRRSRHCSTYM